MGPVWSPLGPEPTQNPARRSPYILGRDPRANTKNQEPCTCTYKCRRVWGRQLSGGPGWRQPPRLYVHVQDSRSLFWVVRLAGFQISVLVVERRLLTKRPPASGKPISPPPFLEARRPCRSQKYANFGFHLSAPFGAASIYGYLIVASSSTTTTRSPNQAIPRSV